MNRYLLKIATTDKPMNNYKLTVTSVSDPARFMIGLRDLLVLSARDRLDAIRNLPYTYEGLSETPNTIRILFEDYAEYTYEQIPWPKASGQYIPPWETPEYLDAKNWYNALPEEDRKRIDTLLRAQGPWG